MGQNRPDYEPGELIGAAAQDFDAAVRELVVDPREIACAAVARIAMLNYPTPAEERAAAMIVRQMGRAVEKLLFNFEYAALRRLVADAEERCMRLCVPKPTPSLQDQLRDGGMHWLQQASWTTEEAEALKLFARHGDRLNDIAPSSVKLGNRTVTRAEVRAELKARGWDEDHLRRLANIEARRVDVDAENVERAKRGQGPILYTGRAV